MLTPHHAVQYFLRTYSSDRLLVGSVGGPLVGMGRSLTVVVGIVCT